MRRLILFFFLLFFSCFAHSQMIKKPVGVSYTGLGAYSLNQQDAFSFIANQASLAQIKHAAAGVYAERRFLLSELNNYHAAIAIPTSSGNFGLKAVYYGFTEYNETQLGLAYAKRIGDKIDLGVQFNYNGISIAGYGNASAVSFEIGSVMHITRQLHAGIHVNNPVGGKFGKTQQEKLPSVYTFGLGYDASENFFISTEIVKEEDLPVNVNAGVQYKFIPQLLARGGVSSATSTYWLGIGILWKALRIDVAGSYHSQLGFTPAILLLFSFKRKEE